MLRNENNGPKRKPKILSNLVPKPKMELNGDSGIRMRMATLKMLALDTNGKAGSGYTNCGAENSDAGCKYWHWKFGCWMHMETLNANGYAGHAGAKCE